MCTEYRKITHKWHAQYGWNGHGSSCLQYRNHAENQRLIKSYAASFASDDIFVIDISNRGDLGWLGQVLVGTVPLSAKRIARWRN